MSKPSRQNKLPVPKPVDSHADERESRIAKQANEAFDREANMITRPARRNETLSGVPMNEELDPARVEEYCEREPWVLTPLNRSPVTLKFGIIPARFEYLANCAEREGDVDKASLHKEAQAKAEEVYYNQMKKDFRVLESRMSRHEIGVYAQGLWTSVTRRIENENDSITGFVDREKLDRMDNEMRELARERIHMNTKWLALVINEIPARGLGGPRPGPLH